MKNLRRFVAVILLLSTLFTLSACANTTIKNDKAIKEFWNTCIVEKKINNISYAFDITAVGGELSSNSYSLILTEDDDQISKIADEIAKIGDVVCVQKPLDEDEEKQLLSQEKMILAFSWDEGFGTITFIDGYVIIQIYDEKSIFEIEYDYRSIAERIKTIVNYKEKIQ